MKTASVVALLSYGLLASAAPRPVKRQTAQVFTHCTQPNTVALTFDDGPYIYARDISDTLTANGAKGTFFYNGNNWRCIYDNDIMDNVRYVYGQGHQVASHTWSHADLSTLTRDQVDDEMSRVEQALQRIVGVTPAFMRPPYGSYNDNVRAVASARGQSLVLWDFDAGDADGKPPADTINDYTNTINQHPNNLLPLNHETYDSTAHQVVPQVVQKLKAAGYKMVTVAECLGMEPYQNVGEPGTPDGDWHC
ncbi:carbohydrate esterase family 4 protein [Marasmius fiardii PR-910]|nr:carbohydrate esterase family 4 protein [Marasmius fiardii PR-910]